VAVLIADTGYELYAACETVWDLEQLYVDLGMEGEVPIIFCTKLNFYMNLAQTSIRQGQKITPCSFETFRPAKNHHQRP
jgi:hypothetical protein